MTTADIICAAIGVLSGIALLWFTGLGGAVHDLGFAIGKWMAGP